jgi:putative transposase
MPHPDPRPRRAVLIFSERHLRAVLAEYEAPLERAATGSPPATPTAPARTPAADLSERRIKRWLVLGGLINEYE